MRDGEEGSLLMREGGVYGSKVVRGTVFYWRDVYGHPLAVEVSNSQETAVIPWRNVAVVTTQRKADTEDVGQLAQEAATSAGLDRA